MRRMSLPKVASMSGCRWIVLQPQPAEELPSGPTHGLVLFLLKAPQVDSQASATMLVCSTCMLLLSP